MKSFIVIAFVAAFVVIASSVPVFNNAESAGDNQHAQQIDDALDAVGYAVGQQSHGIRVRRATCDLLSFSTPIGQLNHAACAAHCLAIGNGYRGGYCQNGVCHCRK